MLKRIDVLVDLPGFGIIDLPLAYTLVSDKNRPGVSIANCKILLDEENLPKWLFATDFSICYVQIAGGEANMVSICTDHKTTNRFHEMMLSIVSSYIKLKEDAAILNEQMLYA